MKTLEIRDSEGATRKMGSTVTEVQQENLEEKKEDEEGMKKKSAPETSEDNDVYSMQALPSDAITNTNTQSEHRQNRSSSLYRRRQASKLGR
jgi:hypothetical protein